MSSTWLPVSIPFLYRHRGSGKRGRTADVTVSEMTEPQAKVPVDDVREARDLFPATSRTAYFNTAAVGLASRILVDAYRHALDDWERDGFDYVRAEAAGESSRTLAAALIGADRSDLALIPSVSSAAGLV